MKVPQYVQAEGSTSYVIGSSNLLDGGTVLTVADVEFDELRSGLFGYPQQSDLTEELETIAIEANPSFHSAIVERLQRTPAVLIDATELGL